MDKNSNFDELEQELQNYKEMSTSINRIKNIEPIINNQFEREPFSDVNLNKKDNFYTEEFSLSKNSFSVNNFVKDLENNLDNFDNIQNEEGPMPANLNPSDKKIKKKKIEKSETEEIKVVSSEEELSINWKELMYKFLIEIKEPVIIIILFILVNNPDFIRVVAKIPYMNRISNQYPSLILRGLILASIVYLLRRNISNYE
jgi:hypothetical protein